MAMVVGLGAASALTKSASTRQAASTLEAGAMFHVVATRSPCLVCACNTRHQLAFTFPHAERRAEFAIE
eukprot:CAMPEP_0179441094 /NCGR_PEP_ID=MMETSP0799-20121207/24684_1 /TAXON_ID=46947 /ORGANISM="Geminigera cryophila, Strain CCMP2564" /LENGTH=68 /DNA_ID=CAMNT_0021225081 /DNA_START=274 /DNA_END=477 /DNA_ORIENTATION=+